jgi:hypothetical protein
MGRLTPEDLGFLFRVCNAFSDPDMRMLTTPFHASSSTLVLRGNATVVSENHLFLSDMLRSLAGNICSWAYSNTFL